MRQNFGQVGHRRLISELKQRNSLLMSRKPSNNIHRKGSESMHNLTKVNAVSQLSLGLQHSNRVVEINVGERNVYDSVFVNSRKFQSGHDNSFEQISLYDHSVSQGGQLLQQNYLNQSIPIITTNRPAAASNSNKFSNDLPYISQHQDSHHLLSKQSIP